LEAAHKKRMAIMDSPSQAVQLALEARSGALEVRTREVEQRISQMQSDINDMERIRQSKDRVVQQVEQFVLDTNKRRLDGRITSGRRSGGIWFWSYEEQYSRVEYEDNGQADRAIAAQNEERHRAEEAKRVLGRQVQELGGVKQRASEELALLVKARQTWKETLANVGLFAAEDEVRRANERLQRAEEVVLQAMKAAGTANPESAARVLSMQHRAQILMNSAATKAEQASAKAMSFTTKFDNMIDQLGAEAADIGAGLPHELLILAKAVTLTGDVHAKRMQLLDNGRTKHQMIRGYLNSELHPAQDQLDSISA